MDMAAPRRLVLHDAAGFAAMRRAGAFAADLLDRLIAEVRPGVTTAAIDALAAAIVTAAGHRNGPLGYHGFPKSLCTSVNHVVCHGIPDDRPLRDGDIVNIDVTPVIDGWYGDTSRMVFVGKPSVKARRLVDLTYDAMMRGIEAVRPGARLGDIGHAIQSFAERHRLGVVRDFCGHGVGQAFQDLPDVMHFGEPGTGMVLEPGMIFTIEPMLTLGRPDTKILADGWTAVTRDRSLSAQFEHSVGVTDDGVEIFTLSPRGRHRPPYDGA